MKISLIIQKKWSKLKIVAIKITPNTTNKNRDNLLDQYKNEEGGLSGVPLREISTKFIKNFYRINKGKIPIIGVGGIDSGESAFDKILSGATAVQLYTGMIYKGPGIVKDIKKDLPSQGGVENIKLEKYLKIKAKIFSDKLRKK